MTIKVTLVDADAFDAKLDEILAAVKAISGPPAEPPPVDPPPVDPPVDPDPPDPLPAPTGAIELGGSGVASGRVTPAFNGHQFVAGGGNLWPKLMAPAIGNVDPNSSAMIAALGGANIHCDFTGDTGSEQYGIPINVVPGNQPRVPMQVFGYPSESDNVPVPIPTNQLSIEGWIKTSGTPTEAEMKNGDDHHCLIAVRDDVLGDIAELFEISKPYKDASGWHCAQISYWNMRSGKARVDGWTSTDAAGLPVSPLLPRYDECQSIDGIRHPIRVTLDPGPLRSQYMFPARHSADGGSVSTGIPFGATLRLTKAWYDAHKDEFTGCARAFIECFRVYGLIVADIGSRGFISAVSDSRFSQANIMTIQAVPLSAFEVMELVPAYRPVVPTTIAAGSVVDCTFVVSPDPDDNPLGGLYGDLYGPDGVEVSYGAEPHPLELAQGKRVMKIAPKVKGTHRLEINQGGRSKLEWAPRTGPHGFPEVVIEVI